MNAVAARDSHGPRMQPKPGRMSEHKPAIEEVHIIWITAGLGCDGDSVSITAATQPSIEDVLLGAIPGLPKVHLHNPVLAYEVGDDFMDWFYKAERGELDPLFSWWKVLFPTRRSSDEGYWAALWDRSRDRPAHSDHEWIDRLAPKAWRWSRPEPARPTVASTRCRAIPQALWAWRTIWVGNGSPKPGCRSSAYPAARFSLTISWKRCSICFTRRRAGSNDLPRRRAAP